jgi:hypothetical protein
MIPRIVFNEKEKTYCPAADFYEITRSPNAPNHISTSGMTQPPVHALSCYYIYKNSDHKSETITFLKNIFPKLMNFHRYLLTDRGPEESGLVTILHPLGVRRRRFSNLGPTFISNFFYEVGTSRL